MDVVNGAAGGGAGGGDFARASPRGGGRRPPAGRAEAEEGQGSLLDALKVAVVLLDATGRVLLWSPAAEEILGWPGERIVGRLLGTVLDPGGEEPGLREGGPGGGRENWSSGPELGEYILDRLLRTGRWEGVVPLRHRDGHLVRVEALASMLVDGDGRPFILASVAEIGRLRRLEHDLAALDSLFDSSPLGVAILDTDLRYVRVNRALARMNGRPVAAHLGRTVAEVHEGWPGAGELARLQRHVLTSGRPVIDLTMPGPTGGYRSLSYSRLEDRAGRVLGISCTIMDVTERRHAAARTERVRQRLALLNDVGTAIADLLDVPRIAQVLARSLVPRFSDYSGVLLRKAVVRGDDLPRPPHAVSEPLMQMGAGSVREGPRIDRMLREGQPIAFADDSVFGAVLNSGAPRLVETPDRLRATTYPGDPGTEAAIDLGIHSLLVLPLRARGTVLGLLVVGRADGREHFDRDDLLLATELASRAGASLDNARLYAREREGALTLQRSLLPQHVPEPPGVEVAFRYVPGSSGTEVGGDWFDVIPLAGGRVAFVVGDVMGHGLRAAATMGRLRTAVRTLAALDLPPARLLRQVNDLADDLVTGPEEALMATCVYVVYDPATRRCTMAKAGHVPPFLVGSGGGARVVDLPSGAPLGVGGVEFESVDLEVPDGSVLVLYTDGLVESRGEDITEGLERLRAVLARPRPSLHAVCDDVLSDLAVLGREPDDVAVLLARLGGACDGSSASWTFPAEAGAVRRARGLVRAALRDWELEPMADLAVLLVGELVTNSLRHARGPIGVRMVRGTSLLVEVSDPLPDPPRERNVTDDDEGGRGLRLVSRSSRRWGTRRGRLGKVVWFELALPGN
ncbi:SpoIIE family protein phosphatase [Streptomyces sp. NPDC059637]|uniref:SpoIIE family protein phosphatase n=1 Tax=Streptomyces sp. NPDC059637 TaxID=3347752 RepID=UPI0036CED074